MVQGSACSIRLKAKPVFHMIAQLPFGLGKISRYHIIYNVNTPFEDHAGETYIRIDMCLKSKSR